VYQVGINKGIILRCTAYQISRMHYVALCGKLALEEDTDYSRLNMQWMRLQNYKAQEKVY